MLEKAAGGLHQCMRCFDAIQANQNEFAVQQVHSGKADQLCSGQQYFMRLAGFWWDWQWDSTRAARFMLYLSS